MNNLQEIERALSARWPETKIDPTLERIALLVDYLGSPQQSYPNIHKWQNFDFKDYRLALPRIRFANWKIHKSTP
jgi:hypothetical protein